jgi:parallel beta-helix repeat protein
MDSCTVEYSARSGIYIESSNPVIVNSTFQHNNWSGVESISSSPLLKNNTFIFNAKGISFSYVSGARVIDNTIVSNRHLGIYLYSSSNNLFSNNYLNNRNNVVFGSTASNWWNSSRVVRTNKVGGPVTGGNYWGTPSNDGFSDTCSDSNADGICDTVFNLTGDWSNVDYLPLAKTNNISAIGPPDFTIVNFTWTPHNYSSGERVVLNATVKNTGTGNWDGVVKVGFYYRNTSLLGYTQQSVTLKPGDIFYAAFVWEDAQTGDFYLKAVVDPDDVVYEADETNNEFSRWVSLPMPDLTIQNITLNVQHPLIRDGKNNDRVFWRYTTTYPGSGWQNAGFNDSTWTVGRTPVGDAGSRRTYLDLKCGEMYFRKVFNATGGTGYLLKLSFDDVVDVWLNGHLIAANLTSSYNYINNPTVYWDREIDISSYVVSGENVLAVRLKDSGCGYNYFDAELNSNTTTVPGVANLSVGDTVRVAVIVKNSGAGSIVSRNISTTLNITGVYSSEIFSKEFNILRLPPGEIRRLTYHWKVKYPDNYSIKAVVDPRNQVDESSETNNVREAGTPHVEYADLIVKSIRWTPANYSVDMPVTFIVTLRNNGTGYSYPGFYTGLYLDGTLLRSGNIYYQGIIPPEGEVNISYTWTSLGGNHSIRAVVDSTGVVPESNESNNALEVSLPYVEFPDLVVANVTWSPATFSSGEGVTITATLKNIGKGNATAGQRQVVFYLDGKYLASRYFYNSLAPNESTNVSISWVATPGNHTIKVIVDATNSLQEGNESNNALEVSLPYVEFPDLVVENVTWPSASIEAGGNLRITAYVKNSGSGNITRGGYVGFYVDGRVIATRLISGPLEAGGSIAVTAEWKGITPGNHTLTVVTDIYSDVIESNESNNALEVSLPYVEFPDLVVENLTFSSPIIAGTPVTITATVKNIGAGNLSQSFVSLSFYVDGRQITTSRVYTGLRAGEEVNISTGWIAVQGMHEIRAFVDSTGSIPELNESNNMRAVNLTVEASDLVISGVSWKPSSNITYGDTITLYANITNNATVDTGRNSFSVDFYIDNKKIESFLLQPLVAGKTVELSTVWKVVGGNHTFRVVVDTLNTVVESNETNNHRSSSLPYIPGPDLVVTNVTLPSSFMPYETIPIVVNITNIGDYTTGLVPSLGVSLSPIGVKAQYTTIKIDPRETIQYTLYWRALPGNHTITVLVDYMNTVGEVNEGNNGYIFTISVPRVYPDLVVTNLSWSPSTIKPGSLIELRATVKNIGSEPAVLYRTHGFFIDGSLVGTNSTNMQLDVNQSVTYTTLWRALSGNHTLSFKVDLYNHLPEENESNNELTLPLPEVKLPDFKIVSVQPVNSLNAIGVRVPFEVKVTNLGEDYEGDIPVQLYQDGMIYYSIHWGKYYISGLKKGEVKSLWLYYLVNSGTHQVKIVVDPHDSIKEVNETNNQYVNNYTTPFPDFAVEIELANTTPIQNYDRVPIKVRVRNNGSGDIVLQDPRVRVTVYANNSQLGSAAYYTLKSGEVKEKTFYWVAEPINGTLNLKAKVEAKLWMPFERLLLPIQEIDSSNNQAETNITLHLPFPDLRVDNITFSPRQVSSNKPFRVNVTVENAGDGLAPKSLTCVYLLGRPYTISTPSIPSGESSTVGIELAVWNKIGNFTISAKSDCKADVVESNESNNYLAGEAITVLPLEEFRIENIRTTAPLNTTLAVRVNVVNAGTATTNLSFRLSGAPSHFKPSQIVIPPQSTRDIMLYVDIPANATPYTYLHYNITALSTTGKNITSNLIVYLIKGNEIQNLIPLNGSRFGTSSPQVSWMTPANSTTEVYYREAGSSSYTRITGKPGIYHAVVLPNLTRGKWYEFFVTSTNSYGASNSSPLSIYIDNGVSFTSKVYSGVVRRDYNQLIQIRVYNSDTVSHRILAKLNNTYDDLIIGFVGSGGDAELSIGPGETATLTIAAHLQNSRSTSYQVPIYLTTVDGSNLTDYATLNLTVHMPVVNFTIRDLGLNATTLERIYAVENHGDIITDFSVYLEGDVTYLTVEPVMDHVYLRKGDVVRFSVKPDLSAYIQDNCLSGGIINGTKQCSFPGFNYTLRAEGAGAKKSIRGDISLPPGKHLYAVAPMGLKIEYLTDFEVDNNRATNPSGELGYVLVNGTPVFSSWIGANVTVNGEPFTNVEVTLFYWNESGVVHNVTTTTGIEGVALFELKGVAGTYSYYLSLDEHIRTPVKTFKVTYPFTSLDIINISEISVGNITYSNFSRIIRVDQYRPLRVKVELNKNSTRAVAFLVVDNVQFMSTYVIRGSVSNTTAEFRLPPLLPGLYTMGAIIATENWTVVSDSVDIYVDGMPLRLTPQDLDVEYGVLQLYRLSILDTDVMSLPLSYNLRESDGGKSAWITHIAPINATHHRIGLILYSTTNLEDNLTVVGYRNGSLLFNITRPVHLTAGEPLYIPLNVSVSNMSDVEISIILYDFMDASYTVLKVVKSKIINPSVRYVKTGTGYLVSGVRKVYNTYEQINEKIDEIKNSPAGQAYEYTNKVVSLYRTVSDLVIAYEKTRSKDDEVFIDGSIDGLSIVTMGVSRLPIFGNIYSEVFGDATKNTLKTIAKQRKLTEDYAKVIRECLFRMNDPECTKKILELENRRFPGYKKMKFGTSFCTNRLRQEIPVRFPPIRNVGKESCILYDYTPSTGTKPYTGQVLINDRPVLNYGGASTGGVYLGCFKSSYLKFGGENRVIYQNNLPNPGHYQTVGGITLALPVYPFDPEPFVADTPDEANNTLHISTAGGTPDLYVKSDDIEVVRIGPLAAGIPTLIRATIYNLGTGISPPYTKVTFYVNGKPFYTTDLGALYPYWSTSIYAHFTPNTTGGTYVIGVAVDSDRRVSEINEANNYARRTIEIPGVLPDYLRIENVSTYFSSGSIHMNATLVAGYYQFYNNVLNDLPVDVYVEVDNTSVARKTVHLNLTGYTDTPRRKHISFTLPTSPGTHTITIIPDPFNTIPAYSEPYSVNVAVSQAQFTLPDLTVRSVSVSPSSPSTGDMINLTVHVMNLGNLSLSRPVNLTVLVNSTPLYFTTLLNMSGTGEASASFNFTLAAGNHTITAIVDPQNLIAESNESNNRLVTRVRITSMDITPPIITIHSPANSTYPTTSISLNVSANEVISAWWYSLDGSANTSFTPNITLTGLADGTHSLIVYANDTSGNTGYAEVSFTVSTPASSPKDNIPPGIFFVPPTPDSGSVVGVRHVYINITSTEPLSTALLEWNGTNRTMQGSGTSWYLNVTGLTGGVYSYRVHASDTSGNWNASTLRFVTVNLTSADITPPVVTIHSPRNLTYGSSIRLQVSASEPVVAWWYSLDGGPGISFTPNTTITNLTGGGHLLVVYARDAGGNVGMARVYFTVDATAPVLSVSAPRHVLQYLGTSEVNFTIAEPNPGSYTLLRNGSRVAGGVYSSGDVISAEVPNNRRGIWNFTLIANDSAGNVATATVMVRILPAEAEVRRNITGMPISVDETRGNTTASFELLPDTTRGTMTLRVSFSRNASELEQHTSNDEFSTYALAGGQSSLGRYLRVKVSGSVNTSSLRYVVIRVSYSPSDLDMNGDGDTLDSGDISEDTLTLWRYCSATDQWQPLRQGNITCGNVTITVYGGGVNTSAKYVWVNLSRLSLFALAGESVRFVSAPPVAGGSYYPEVVLLANVIDLPLAEELVEHIRQRGIKLYIVDAYNFSGYSDRRYVIVLGGHRAYSGVGEIVASMLSENETELVAAGNVFLKKRSVFRSGQIVYIFAGKDRYATAEAWREVYKDVVREIEYNWG